MEDYRKHGTLEYPAGTPESFDRLAEFFDDIRGDAHQLQMGLVERLFPEISNRIDKYWLGVKQLEEASPVSQSVLNASVDRYLANLERMRDLVTAGGGRFVGVFQPLAGLHSHVERTFAADSDAKRRFHDAFIQKDLHHLEFDDLSAVFDRYYAAVPVLEHDIGKDTVFVDNAHLYDPGNSILARELWRIVCAGASPGMGAACR